MLNQNQWYKEEDLTDQLKSAYDLRLAQLGLTNDDTKLLGLELLDQQTTINEINFCPAIGSIKIPYFDLKSNTLPFARYRFLNYQGKNKYIQNGLGNKVYFPPFIPNWKEVLQSKKDPLIITEGEFKAIVSCKARYTAIALGGVFSFCSYIDRFKSNNILNVFNLLPKGKQVFICFDYDGTGTGEPKDQIKYAEYTLASILAQRGIEVSLVRLGEANQYEKVGLDDYILEGKDLQKKLDQAIPLASIKDSTYIKILSRYANFHGDVLDLKTGRVYSHVKFKSHISNEYIDGDPAYKTYTSSKHRLIVDSFTFNPNDDHIVTSSQQYNTWRGYYTEPVKDNIDLWLKFEELFFANEPELQHHFDLWIANYFQNPGTKQFRIPILQSQKTGTGKSTFLETIVYIANGGTKDTVLPNTLHPALVAEGDLLGKAFNSLYEGKNLIVFNEAGERGDKVTNKLKDLITSSYLTIEHKFQAPYQVPNYLNLAITTNEKYTHFIQEDSRRELVYDFSDEKLVKKILEFYKTTALHSWAWSKQGLQALMYYYMTFPLNGYTGKEPAPNSRGKTLIAELQAEPIVLFYKEELQDKDVILPREEYAKFMDWAGTSKMNYARFKAELEKLNFKYHINASSVRQINLTSHGLTKLIVMFKNGWEKESKYELIATKLKEQYVEGTKL